MSAGAVFLVLMSAAMHVGWNYLTKSSASPRAFSLLKGTVLVVPTLMVLPFIPLKPIPPGVWIYVGLSGALHAVYIVALSTAYETGDISYVYPIARSAPAFVPVAAFAFLGERVSPRGAAGITVVVVSVLAIQLWGEGLTRRQGLWAYAKRKESLWAYLTLATVVAFSLVDKAGMVAFSGVRAVGAAARGPIYFLLENAICYILFWGYAAARRTVPVRGLWKDEWPRVAIGAAVTVASYSAILHVLQTEKVSYVLTLRQFSVLLAVAVGRVVLREPAGALRLGAALAMVFGLYLVVTAS